MECPNVDCRRACARSPQPVGVALALDVAGCEKIRAAHIAMDLLVVVTLVD